jgi:hypothetical protein
MNAVPRSVFPAQHPRSRRPAASSRVMRSRAALSSTVTSMPSRTAGQKIERLNVAQRPTPIWLSSLLLLKRSSDVITFLLVAATLTVYSWTVYTQQQWSREYRKLDNLQRNERQLTTANAVFKDQLAQQAESPSTGLVTPTPANTIFLPPAPQRQSHSAPTKTADPEPVAKTPLGY